MNTNTILVAFLVGVVLVVGYAQSRFETCKQQQQKTISCVFEFE